MKTKLYEYPSLMDRVTTFLQGQPGETAIIDTRAVARIEGQFKDLEHYSRLNQKMVDNHGMF